MTLDPTFLPPKTYQSYKLGAGAWPSVIRTAAEEGIKDIDCLADIVFYLHHPEMEGRPLVPGETSLIDQWKQFRSRLPSVIPAPSQGTFYNGMSFLGVSWDAPMVRGYDGSNRMWRSRNGHILEGRPTSMDMWSWHEAARTSAFDPLFTGGVFVASR